MVGSLRVFWHLSGFGFFRFDGESALRPTTTNANRWAMIMFKKRYLSILVVLLLVVSTMVPFGIEWYRIYTVCRNEMLSSGGSFYRDWEYQYTVFFPQNDSYPPITVVFGNEKSTVWCRVRRSGLGWEVTSIGDTMGAPLP
jgi:hypothetical protein